MYTPCKPVLLHKNGFKGSTLYSRIFVMSYTLVTYGEDMYGPHMAFTLAVVMQTRLNIYYLVIARAPNRSTDQILGLPYTILARRFLVFF